METEAPRLCGLSTEPEPKDQPDRRAGAHRDQAQGRGTGARHLPWGTARVLMRRSIEVGVIPLQQEALKGCQARPIVQSRVEVVDLPRQVVEWNARDLVRAHRSSRVESGHERILSLLLERAPRVGVA